MKCRLIVISAVIICAVLWIIGFVRINTNIIQPLDQPYRVGESFHYYGLEITPIDAETYDSDSFKNEFGYDFGGNNTEGLLIVAVKVHVKNISGESIKIKNNLHTWVIETDYFRNGQQIEFAYLNREEPYTAGSDMEYYLFFTFRDGENYQGGIKRLKSAEKRVYFGFYPEARYMLFEEM